MRNGESDGKPEYVYRDGSRFIRTDAGLVYSPEFRTTRRKHDCADCMECAMCPDGRCLSCRGDGEGEQS